MIPMLLSEIRDVTGGRVHGDVDPERVVVDGPVTTDSRECGPGGLYVARVGEFADGHTYAAAAAAAGAVAALTSRPLDDLPCVVVDDVQLAPKTCSPPCSPRVARRWHRSTRSTVRSECR